jgi:hypothetical protein
MIKYDYCPICKSKDIKIIKEEIYQYPKSKGIGWEEVINTRLRKLFDVILKSREEIVFNVFKCNKCSFIFRMPRLNEEEINKKYNLDNKGLPYFWPIRRPPDKTIPIREERIYQIIKKYGKGFDLLDIGGCDGAMCRRLKDEYKCFIIDKVIYEKIGDIIHLGDDIGNNNIKYDVIMMIHILEHLSYPLEFLKKYKNHIKKDGILLVATPRGHIKEWKGRNDPTMHCNYFSMETLKKAITLAGWETIYDIEYKKDYEELYMVGKLND